MFITTIFVLYMFNVARSAVLDPSLYLSPGPPLTDSAKDLSPSELWSRRFANIKEHSTQNPTVVVKGKRSKEDSEDMDRAETFWPFVRSTEVKLGGVNIPLTFSVSGTYSKLSPPSGIISSSYIGVPGAGSIFGNYGKSGLAGSGYGRYGSPSVNVYGGNNQPTWSGWGNGKWGHYGKG